MGAWVIPTIAKITKVDEEYDVHPNGMVPMSHVIISVTFTFVFSERISVVLAVNCVNHTTVAHIKKT